MGNRHSSLQSANLVGDCMEVHRVLEPKHEVIINVAKNIARVLYVDFKKDTVDFVRRCSKT